MVHSATLLVVAYLLAFSAGDTDWLQWGGPNRDFSVEAPGLADQWPEAGPKELWSRDLGPGYSGIVVADGILYTMYRKSFTGNEEFTVALDARTGKVVWERENAAPMDKAPDAAWGGQGPNATPLIVGEQLFTIGSNALMQCIDRKSGRVIWERDLGGEFGASYMAKRTNVGHSSSPIAYRNTVIVPLGRARSSDVDERQSLVALDQKDGHVVWTSLDFESGFSSPILIEYGGKQHLVLHVRRELLGIDPRDGSLLWRHSAPEGGGPVVTPLWIEGTGLLIKDGGDGGAAHLVELTTVDGKTVPRERWSSPHFKLFVPSPVLVGKFLYGSTDQFLVALDAATGERAWAERGFPSASILRVGGKLILLDENGQLSLVTATSEGPTVHSRHQVTEKYSLTVPTLVGHTLFVRDQKRILALDLGSSSPDTGARSG